MRKVALWLDLIRWNRPAGWLLLLWPTLSALWVAADGFPGWHLLAVFTAGTILMRSAGCCINDVADRHIDRQVSRTALRPITRGDLGVREALAVGAVLALVAFLLVLTTNGSTVLLSFAALAVAMAYPWAKRVFQMPQAVLGLAFGMGIPMAFSAVLGAPGLSLQAITDAVPWQAWALMAANACWVLAYDTEYAMVDRDDDRLLPIHSSALTLGRLDVPAVAVFYALHLLGWAGTGLSLGLGGWFLAACALAAAQAVWHLWLIRHRQRQACFRAFTLNHWMGATLFAGIVLDLLWR
jgi:4-hydroxybenzoate polyprenyltransferase